MLKRFLAIGCVAAALAAPLTLTTPAHAGVDDAGGALLTTALDVAAATLGNASNALADPNTTCKVTAAGDNAVQRVNYQLGENHAQDVVAGDGECVSLSSGTYNGTVTVYDQVFTATSATSGTWGNACGASATGASIAGVLKVQVTKLCTFPFPSAGLGKYHRAKAVLSNSRGQVFVDYTPVWYVNS